MIRTTRRASLRRYGWGAAAALIAIGMATSLARHGGPMWGAASRLGAASLAIALALAVIYRVVNASGWGMVLRALGEPVGAVSSARIWLAAEACRWLPGSLWSFGSRAVLASRRGLAGPIVAASLALELAVTVAAWAVVAAIGGPYLRIPGHWRPGDPASAAAWVGLGAILAGACGLWAWRSERVMGKVKGLILRFRDLGRIGVSWPGLWWSFVFYLAMAAFNGAILVVIVRASPGGASCPVAAVIAANAVAWLVGFFALFSPGGLVVREACLAALLAPWLPPEQAIAVALAWRLVQIAAEVACFAAVVAWGLPATLKAAPTRPATPDGASPTESPQRDLRPHLSESTFAGIPSDLPCADRRPIAEWHEPNT